MSKPLVTDVELEKLLTEELPQLAVMHLQVWRQAYKGIFPPEALNNLQLQAFEQAWQQRTADGGREISWINMGGQRLGFLSYRQPEQRTIEITHFYLLPAHWGTGVAVAAMRVLLLQLLAKGIQQIQLWVLEENLRAQRFYARCGFEKASLPRHRQQYGLQLHEKLMVYRFGS